MGVDYPPDLTHTSGERSPNEVVAEARALFAKRAAVLLVGLLIIVTVGVGAVGTVLIRNAQVNNTPTLVSAKAAAEAAQRGTKRIEDCTTPGGDCYERAQRQTASAVADINRVVILATACSAGLPRGLDIDERQARIQSCVITRLAQQTS